MDGDLGAKYWHWLFHLQPDLPERLAGADVEGYLRYFLEKWTYAREGLEPSAIAEYVRAFSQPGALRCGFDDYRAHPVDSAHDEEDHAAGPARHPAAARAVGRRRASWARRCRCSTCGASTPTTCAGRAIERCGHFVPEERPAEVVEELRALPRAGRMRAVSSPLKIEADPEELGFDPARLDRIEQHFTRYVDDGRLAGWHAVVARDGKVVHSSSAGHRDAEAGLPVTDDTRWRIYSMTKPITSVAAMMLWERGLFELTDPISRWLPEFAEPRVYVKGSSGKPLLEAATEPIRVWHLLTHTAGLTYGFHHAHAVDELYRAAGFEWSAPPGPRPRRLRRGVGAACRWCSSRARSGTTATPPTSSAGSSRSCRASRSTPSSRRTSSARSG